MNRYGLRIRLRRARGLRRFLEAQDLEVESPLTTVYELARDEMRAGKKLGHWMWFIFPQEFGLGSSFNSRVYGLTRREASRYLNHPVLSARLLESFEALVVGVAKSGSVISVLGELDAKKVQSCLCLFESVAPGFNDSLRQELRSVIGVGQ